MIKKISFNKFVQEFEDHGRENQFSEDALKLIYNFLSELDSNYELDVIGVCCDFTENYMEEVAQDLGYELVDLLDNSELVEAVLERFKEALKYDPDLFQFMEETAGIENLSNDELLELLSPNARTEIEVNFDWTSLEDNLIKDLSRHTTVVGCVEDRIVYMSY